MEKPGVMKMPNVECCRRNALSFFLILLCGAGFLCDAMDFKGEGKNVVMKSDAILFNGSGKAKALSPRRVHAQYRMVFEYKADTEGTLKITLYFKNGSSGSHALKLMPDRIFRRTVLALDGDFKLHDSFFDLNQTVLSWKSNRNGNVMIRKIRIVPESELAGSAKFLVVPSRLPKKSVSEKNPVRVYFELDNDDLRKEVPKADCFLPDPCPYAGFRDRVLAGAESLIRRVDTPEEADVIVYSRALAGAHPQLADAVGKGKRLLLYGWVADPEIRALSPLEMTPLPSSGIPVRTTLIPVAPDPVWENESLLNADYGVYYRTRLRSGTALLKGREGTVFAARNGNVLHFINGIGNALLENRGFFDRGFLRALIGKDPERLRRLEEIGREREKTERDREKTLLKSILGEQADLSGWRVGVSTGGFGRFGWAVEEGLQCASLLNDLSIENGSQYFRFEPVASPKQQPVIDWKGRIVSGKPRPVLDAGGIMNPLVPWSGEGTVELSAQVIVNPEWKGKEISFYVEKGIDDTDETRFNGVLIGKTDVSVPEYWRTPRRYRIPEHLIRFGETNTLTVRQTNIRAQGSFGSRPVLRIEEKEPSALPTLRVTDINWVSKEYTIEDGENRSKVRLSLLSPFTMFAFESREIMLTLEERTAQYAAWPTANGIRVVRISGDFYRRARDGAWSAPWLLLFRKNWENGRPLLLVFSHQPESLTARMNGYYVNGIRIRAAGPLKQIAAGWPWGIKPVYTGKWIKGLPEKVIRHLERDVLPMALNFPVACDEIFRIDRSGQTIEVINRFRNQPMQTAWSLPVQRWAALPPLAAFGVRQKLGASAEENLHDFQVFATHGPVLGRIGTDMIRYKMPLYQESGFVPVDVAADPDLHAEIDRGVSGGVRWSWGGGVRYEELDYAWPLSRKRRPQVRTIDLSNWLYGLGNALQGFYGMNRESRKKIMERVTRRMIAPYEQAQYKLQGRYREEPFSGVRYTINFLSVRALGTKFAPGFGSEVQYGDCNEACTHLAWIAQQLGDRMGYAPWIRANWNAFKDSMSFSWVINDYCHMAGSLNDQGSGAWVDMLNGEFAGMMAFARIARIAGDRETEEQALYRAARKALPTLLRFRMRHYWNEAWPRSERNRDFVCIGFGENKIFTLEFPLTPDYNFRNSNELFDYAQGTPGFTIQLYWKYIAPEVRDYLQNYSRKVLVKDRNFLGEGAYIRVFSLFGKGDEPVGEWRRMDSVRRGKSLTLDWPGITSASKYLPVLWRDYGKIAVVESSGILLSEAKYIPERHELNLEVKGLEAPSLLRIASGGSVCRVQVNGREVKPESAADGSLILRPEIGKISRITVNYEWKERKSRK